MKENALEPSLETWNRAHDRLVRFLNTFALSDHPHVSRLALELLDRARAAHREDPSRDPTTLTMEQAQSLLAEWLAKNLQEEHESPAKIMTTGYIALLLSRLYQVAPDSFLEFPLPEEVRKSMQQTLVTTGPDLNVSSMTPRHLDYGPMLDFARQTWHRWDARTFFIALLFWAGIYVILYLWLSGNL
jgi:hypothetical protein